MNVATVKNDNNNNDPPSAPDCESPPVIFHDCVETLVETTPMNATNNTSIIQSKSQEGRSNEFFFTPTAGGPSAGATSVTPNHDQQQQQQQQDVVPFVNDGQDQYNDNEDPHTGNDAGNIIDDDDNGSSIPAAIFNFTNSIIGAGCIGLGGAIAMSGGLISISLIIFFAILTKASLDLVIRLSVEWAAKQQQQQQRQQQRQENDPENYNQEEGNVQSLPPPSSSSSSPSIMSVSYEDLAQAGMGSFGRLLVMACKFSYSFGCLIAYIIVIKDNCGPAIKSLVYGGMDGESTNDHDHHHNATIFYDYEDNNNEDNDNILFSILEAATTTSSIPISHRISHWCYILLSDNAWFTWTVSAVLILPLCMLRDMTPLASASLISVVSMIMIVVIVIYMYIASCPDEHGQPQCATGSTNSGSDMTFYEKWIEVRPGLLSNLGTFIFTFVSQHTVHLVFTSLQPKLQTVSNWKIVSSWSIFSAATVSLLVGVFVYMTFWEHTQSDIFLIYPRSWMIDTAKLLLCVTMIFTFPLPFFTCRELIVVTIIHPFCGIDWRNNSSVDESDNTTNDQRDDTRRMTNVVNDNDNEITTSSLAEPLLPNDEPTNDNDNTNNNSSVFSDAISVTSELSRRVLETAGTPKNWLLPNDNRQLLLPGHVSVTFKLWLIVTGLAIAAPSLGDILDLVGCASGTLIAFIIPAILSFRLEGYTNLALLILVVGGVVGTVGTYYSVRQLLVDLGL